MKLLIVLASILCIMAIIWLAIGYVVLLADDVHDFFEDIAYKRAKKRGKKK